MGSLTPRTLGLQLELLASRLPATYGPALRAMNPGQGRYQDGDAMSVLVPFLILGSIGWMRARRTHRRGRVAG